MIEPFPVTLAIADAMPCGFAIRPCDRETLRMVNDAMCSGNFTLAFQPVYPAQGAGGPLFHEALLRLRDAEGRLIPARDFIEVAEENETGRQLDCIALTLGLSALGRDPALNLSVNMSARSVGYAGWIAALEAGLSTAPELAHRLIIEITEASAMEAPEATLGFMRDLAGRGIRFALDDFGAGSTSFRYLRNFAFDMIKIDGQFVRGVHGNPDSKVLLEALISIGRHFGMLTVAEAVETAEEAACLAAAGVDCLQGYYLAPPMPQPQR